MKKSLLKKIFNKLSPKKYFITGLNSGYKNLQYRALLYYKTAPLLDKSIVSSYSHTNLWEITEIVSILNHFGFVVDVIDRGAKNFIPEDKYDLFIGLTSGGSGRFFGKYARAMPHSVKIALATTTEPSVANDRGYARYHEFKERTGIDAPPMRVFDIGFREFLSYIDYIFCYGQKGAFSFNSYKKYKKPIYTIMPGTSPHINFNPKWLKSRKRNRFVCFAGNGFIYKGVDLLVEAFIKMPDCYLTICGPDSEKAFFKAYDKIIKTRPNITYEGFIKVGGARFQELCSACSFVILHSASEGCCTSVATMMRAGLVPIVNPETGIDVGNFGFLMTDADNKIQDIINTVQEAARISYNEYSSRVYKTLKTSILYTQSSFTEHFTKALLDVMEKEERFH